MAATSHKPLLVTKSEYARRRGKNPAYIGDLVKAGKLPKRRDGKIDPAVCDPIMDQLAKSGPPQLRAHHEAMKAAKASRIMTEQQIDDLLALPSDIPSATVLPFKRPVETPRDEDFTPRDPYSRARLTAEQFKAKQVEIDYRRSVGELLEKPKVEAAVAECANLTRAILERLPDRAGERLAAVLKTDTSTVVMMLQAEIEGVCAEISAAVEALADKVEGKKGGDGNAPF